MVTSCDQTDVMDITWMNLILIIFLILTLGCDNILLTMSVVVGIKFKGSNLEG